MNSYSNSSFRINLKSKAYIKLIVQTKYVKLGNQIPLQCQNIRLIHYKIDK